MKTSTKIKTPSLVMDVTARPPLALIVPMILLIGEDCCVLHVSLHVSVLGMCVGVKADGVNFLSELAMGCMAWNGC